MKVPFSEAPLVRAGDISPWKEYARGSQRNLPSKFPVLSSTGMEGPGAAEHTAIGTGTLPCGDFQFVTIRLQTDSRQYYWLADPHDVRLWSMFDAWAKQRQAVFALAAGPGAQQIVALPNDGAGIGTRLRSHMAGVRDVPHAEYAEEAVRVVLSGVLQMGASSDCPEVRFITRADACLLSSPKLEAGMRELEAKGTIDSILSSFRKPVAPLGTRYAES